MDSRGFDHQDPAALVWAFIADFFSWNAAAYQRSKRTWRSPERLQAAIEESKRDYAALLGRYCRPGFSGEPIAFGSSSRHDPEREVILSTSLRGERCLIKTQKIDDYGENKWVRDYEFRLSQDDGRWYLDSVKCVVNGQGHESL